MNMSSIFFSSEVYPTKQKYGEIKSKPWATFSAHIYIQFLLWVALYLSSLSTTKFQESCSSAAIFFSTLITK